MTLQRRIIALECATGTQSAQAADIDAAAIYVDAMIAEIVSRSTDDERTGMAKWWACCRKMVATDPSMAKIFAGFSPDDLIL